MSIYKKVSTLLVASLLGGFAFANPTVLHGGPYVVTEGQSLILTDSGSTGSGGASISLYSWDINSDAIEDASGSTVSFSWAALESMFGTGAIANNLLTYPVSLSITDSDGYTANDTTQFTVQNALPSSGTLSVGNTLNEIYAGLLLISWSGISDPANGDILITTLTHSSGTVLATGDPVVFTGYTWDTTSVADGAYTLVLTTSDDVGSSYTTTLYPITIDNTGPVLLGATGYSINEGSGVTFDLSSSADVAGISGYTWDINGTIVPTTTGILTLSRAQLEGYGITNDGVYTIPVTGTDTLGHTSSTSITLTVNNIAPTISLSTPVTGYYSGAVAITWIANDVIAGDLPLNIQLTYSNGIYSGVITGGTGLANPYSWDTSLIPDGTGYTITATASDDDASTVVVSQPFTIDNNAPVISTGYISINEGDTAALNLLGLITDISPLTLYTFDINNDNAIDFSNTGGSLSLTWAQLQTFGIINNNATLLPSDVYNIKVTARDSVSITGTGTFELKVYNLSPVVTLDSPITTGAIYSGDLLLARTITDPANGDFLMPTDILYSDNNITYSLIANTTSDRTGSLVWDTTTMPDGTNYTIRVRSTDDYGNNQKTSVKFSIDNTAPSISGELAYTIAEGSGVTFDLSSTTDAIAGVAGYTWDVNSNITGNASGILPLSRVQLQTYGITTDGIYSIPVTVVDTIGNTSYTTITLTVTNTPPTVTVSQPITGIYSGNVSIQWTATDPANGDLPLTIVLRYSNADHSGIITSGTALSNPYTWNVGAIPDGTGYTVTVEAFDDDTSTAVQSQSFSIDHTAPAVQGFTSPFAIKEGSGFILDLSATTDAIAGMSGGDAGFNGFLNSVALPFSTTGYWSFTRPALATYGITNGMNQSLSISATVSDSIKNTTTLHGNVVVENIIPVITITAPNGLVTGTTTIGRTTYDPVDATDVAVRYATGSTGPWTAVQTGLNGTTTGITWNTLPHPDGGYYIKITARDDIGTGEAIRGPIEIDNVGFVGGVGNGGGGGGGGGSSTPSNLLNTGGSGNTSTGNTMTGATTTGNALTGDAMTGNALTGENTEETGYDTQGFDKEMFDAYTFAFEHGITTMPTIHDALPYGDLYRKDAAKIMVEFATLLGKDTIAHETGCEYEDVKNLPSQTISYINEACKRGIMGLDSEGKVASAFNPNGLVTRAQLGTMLSRLLYGDTYNVPMNGTIVWYEKHLEALKSNGILNDISSPNNTETRGFVWIMLQRVFNQK